MHSSDTGTSLRTFLRTFLWTEKRYGLMQFTQVIFNTYSLFLESAAKAKWTPAFLMFKNSLLLSCCVGGCVNAKKNFSTNAPLKIYLSRKPAARLLSDNSILLFLSLVHSPILMVVNLCSTAKSKSKTQGK